MKNVGENKSVVFIILFSVVIKYINKKNIGLIKEKNNTFEQEDFFFLPHFFM